MPGEHDSTYVPRSDLKLLVEGIIGGSGDFATTQELEDHETDTTSIHGIADTSLLSPDNSGIFNVKDYGAEGDGATDDSDAIQDALDAARTAGGQVYVPAGTYLISTTLVLYSDVHLVGAGPVAATIKLANSANTDILTVDSYGVNGIMDYSIRDLSFDGNSANNTSGSGLVLDGTRFLLDNLRISYCAVDGLNAQETVEGVDTVGGMDSFIRSTKVWFSGRYNIRIDGHDWHMTDVIGIGKDSARTRTNFLIDSRAAALKAVNCHAWGECTDYGWHFKNDADLMNCESEGALTANVFFDADNIRWTGGKVFVDNSDHGRLGFKWNTAKGYNVEISGTRVQCPDGAYDFTDNDGGNSRISGIVSQASGDVVLGSPSSAIRWDVTVFGGATDNIPESSDPDEPLSIETAAADTNVLDSIVTGDSNNRFNIQTDGEMGFGPGSGGADTFLRRSGVGEFEAVGDFSITGNLLPTIIETASAGTNAIQAIVSGDANSRFYAQGDGEMGWGPGNAAVDVFLKRSGARELEIVGDLSVNGNIDVTGTITGQGGASWDAGFVIAANMDRVNNPMDDQDVLTSGTLYLSGGTILPKDKRVTSLRVRSGSQAADTPTRQWFCLVDQDLNVLAKTADDTTTAWGTNSTKQLDLASAYTPTEDIAVYIGVVVVATRVPFLRGRTFAYEFGCQWDDPDLCGDSTTGLTDPASLGARAGATTPTQFLPFVMAV